MRITDIWLIRAISNLHAGSGDADFGVIDKHVQRDPVTHLPTIFASSIKGALRELFDTDETRKALSTDIFGTDTKAPTSQQGLYRFYDAQLLALPVRASQQFYYLAVCPEIIQDFLDHLERHGHTEHQTLRTKLASFFNNRPAPEQPLYLGEGNGTVTLEDYAAKNANSQIDGTAVKVLFDLFDVNRLAIFHCDDFHQLNKNLPTVARNYLENGISKNLWYEEIVPRETRFYCPISRPTQADFLGDHLNNQQSIANHVQIGGNATVGYGLCQMTKLPQL